MFLVYFVFETVELRRQISCSLQLMNKTDDFVAFKVLSNLFVSFVYFYVFGFLVEEGRGVRWSQFCALEICKLDLCVFLDVEIGWFLGKDNKSKEVLC